MNSVKCEKYELMYINQMPIIFKRTFSTQQQKLTLISKLYECKAKDWMRITTNSAINNLNKQKFQIMLLVSRTISNLLITSSSKEWWNSMQDKKNNISFTIVDKVCSMKPLNSYYTIVIMKILNVNFEFGAADWKMIILITIILICKFLI